jgi:FtsP/CotA-like multicopper oxidase with cupredoxin domain
MTRRSALAGLAASSAAAAAGFRAGLRLAEAAEPQPLRIPDLIDARAQGNAISLRAQAGQTAFVPGRESATRGFNGGHLGPTLRLHRGDEVEIAVVNAMRETTAVHWHGLLIPAEADGGPHQTVEPGATWRPRMKVDQSAATLWYHAHVHGDTARQVYGGLAGMILVGDEAERALGLPLTYGIDDIPLLLQDKLFDDSRLVHPQHPVFMIARAAGRHDLGQRHLERGRARAARARTPAPRQRLQRTRLRSFPSTMAAPSTGSAATPAYWKSRSSAARCGSLPVKGPELRSLFA